jgi:hypothetical protein
MFCGGALTWVTQKQDTVSWSSSEAEYIAAGSAGQDIVWLRQIFDALCRPSPDPTKLHIDNATALIMATDEGTAARRRHINIRHHKLREWVAEGIIKPCKIDTREQLADIFTKALGREPFTMIRDVILGDAPASSLTR